VAVGGVLSALAAAPGLLGDELYTFAVVDRDSAADVMDGVRTTENTPPLYYLVAWMVTKISGSPELIRLPSLLAGAGTVAVVGLLGRRVFGAPAGLAAAALLAVAPFSVYYTSEARSYSAATLCVVLSTLLLLKALDRPRPALWTALAVSAAAAVWFHYTAILPLGAQAVWAVATQPGSRRTVSIAHLAAALLYVPWLPFLGANVSLDVVSVFSPFAAEQVLEYPARALAGHPIAGLADVPGSVPALGIALVLGGAAALALRRGGLGRPSPSSPAVLLAAMALAAPVGVLLYSAFDANLFVPRNLLVSVPPAAVMAGAMVARTGSPAIAAALTVALVALLLPSALATATGSQARPRYDDVARLVDERGRPGDPVIEAPLFPVGESLDAPLRRPLAIFLERPHPLYLSDRPRDAWRRAVRAGRALVVHPGDYPPVFRSLIPAPPRGSGLMVVRRQRFEGVRSLVYVEYVRRPTAGR